MIIVELLIDSRRYKKITKCEFRLINLKKYINTRYIWFAEIDFRLEILWTFKKTAYLRWAVSAGIKSIIFSKGEHYEVYELYSDPCTVHWLVQGWSLKKNYFIFMLKRSLPRHLAVKSNLITNSITTLLL